MPPRAAFLIYGDFIPIWAAWAGILIRRHLFSESFRFRAAFLDLKSLLVGASRGLGGNAGFAAALAGFQLGEQPFEGQFAVALLGAMFTGNGGKSGGDVNRPHRRRGAVGVLSAGAAGRKRLKANLFSEARIN